MKKSLTDTQIHSTAFHVLHPLRWKSYCRNYTAFISEWLHLDEYVPFETWLLARKITL